MSKEYFVNRHGKKLDIDGIVDDIQGQEDSHQTAPQPQRSPTPLPVNGEPRQRRRIPKKVWGALLGTSLLFAGVLLVVADTARRDYNRQTVQMKSSVTDTNKKVASTGATAVDTLKGVRDNLQQTTACSTVVPQLIVDSYAPARSAKSSCQVTATNYQNLQKAIDNNVSYASYLQMQQKILAPALTMPSDGSFAGISVYADAWKTAKDSLQSLKVDADVDKEHSQLLADVTAIAILWTALQTANSEQNATAFTEVEAQLVVQYETLRRNGDAFTAKINNLQTKIDTAVALLQ